MAEQWTENQRLLIKSHGRQHFADGTFSSLRRKDFDVNITNFGVGENPDLFNRSTMNKITDGKTK